MNSQKSRPSGGKEMSADSAVNLVAIEVYRPLTMRQWFHLDPVANKVSDKTVGGVRCEIAEAVALPDGCQVIWRISGIAQCAENARDLECARINKVHQVNLGTLKVDPVKITSIPNRIVTRTVINVLPHPLLDIERIDDETPHRSRPGPKCSKEQLHCAATTSKHGSRSVKKVKFDETAATADIKQEDEPKEAEVVLRPPAPTADDPDVSQDSLSGVLGQARVKEELIDDTAADEMSSFADTARATIKQEPLEYNEGDAENVRTVSTRRGKNANRRSVPADRLVNVRKRPSRGEILRSEKKLREEPILVSDPARERRPMDSECEDIQGHCSIYIESKLPW